MFPLPFLTPIDIEPFGISVTADEMLHISLFDEIFFKIVEERNLKKLANAFTDVAGSGGKRVVG